MYESKTTGVETNMNAKSRVIMKDGKAWNVTDDVDDLFYLLEDEVRFVRITLAGSGDPMVILSEDISTIREFKEKGDN